jgi:hypothetical protein
MHDDIKSLRDKLNRQEDLSTEKYFEGLRTERPDYYADLSNLINNWETLDQAEIERIGNRLDPEDWEIFEDYVDV